MLRGAFLELLESEPAPARQLMAALTERVRTLERAPAPRPEQAPVSWPIPDLS
jgi:hypothetical protein